MPRPCLVCQNPKHMQLVAKLVAEGVSDLRIAQQIGMSGNAGRMSVARHRTWHIQKPAEMVARAAAKDAPERKKRQELVEAVENGDQAQMFLGLNQITTDLQAVHARLTRVADAAEVAGNHGAIAPLSAQQLKSLDTRGKLAGLPGFVAPKAGPAAETTFSVVFQFSGGREERIVTTVPGAPTIDAVPLEEIQDDGDEGDEPLEDV